MKIKLIIAIFLINITLYAQSVEGKFKNAELNSDFTSTFAIQKNEIVGLISVNKWIKDNPSYFDHNYGVSVPAGKTNWFYGATRNTAEGFSFVKSENIGKRAKYLAENSKTYQEFISVITTYSQYTSDFENFGLNLINSSSDYKDFKNRYPQSNNEDTAFLNAFNSPVLKNSDSEQFFSYLKSLPVSKLSSLSTKQKVNMTDFILNYKNPTDISGVSNVLSEFKYLASYESAKSALEYTWNMYRNSGVKGDNLLSTMAKIGSNFVNSGWDFPNATKQFVYQKLEDEVKKNVTITNVRYISSNSAEFEKWKNQLVTSAYVADDNAAKYLVYGNVENNSEFTLPLDLKTVGVLKVKLKASGGSNDLSNLAVTGYNIIEKIAGFLEPGSKEIMDRARTINEFAFTSDDYFLPSVKPSANHKWAILLDFSPIVKQIGLNPVDGIKIFNDLILEQIQGKATYTPNKLLSSEDIKKQNEWQRIAQNGLSTGGLYDFYRNEKVDFDYWEVKSEEKRERQRQWEEQQRQQKITNDKNSQVIYSENAKVNLKVHMDSSQSKTINIYTRGNQESGCCYSTKIYKYDAYKKGKGALVKEFKNEKGIFNLDKNKDRDDNYYTPYEDYPLIVDVWYTYKNKDVIFSVFLEKGAEIEVLPENK